MQDWASLIAQLVKNSSAMRETPVQFLGWEDPLERDRLPIPVFLGLPGGSDSKEPTCNVGDLGLNPGLGRSPGEGKGNPIRYSCLKTPRTEKPGRLQSWVCKESGMTE